MYEGPSHGFRCNCRDIFDTNWSAALAFERESLHFGLLMRSNYRNETLSCCFGLWRMFLFSFPFWFFCPTNLMQQTWKIWASPLGCTTPKLYPSRQNNKILLFSVICSQLLTDESTGSLQMKNWNRNTEQMTCFELSYWL